MARPTKALINISALQHNYRLAQTLSGAGQAMPIIKANAYGHGAVLVARALSKLAPAFGVACIEEALELRQAGIKQPILLLEGCFTADEIAVAVEHNFWLMIDNQLQLDSILTCNIATPVTVWLKVDTGMHRLGFDADEVESVYRQACSSNNVAEDIIVATHFACADDLSSEATVEQIAVFNSATANITAAKSLANSPGLLGWPEARAEWNRSGFMLYGNSPFSQPQVNGDQLKPVMSLQSAIISLRTVDSGESVGYAASWTAQRQSRVATIAIGYGDGYPRKAPSGTPVYINGQRVPLIGRVSMDMITVDVTDLAEVAIGDTVELWGEHISANEVAGFADTIGYEVMTRMPLRVPRIGVE
ncbi:Alanine racemase [Sinobacterium norvegicum]|uniref:Alanine racemase n=1 Tax=Sinobacterium norvegicum TaxID=1641715 RepID=A0ABN8ECP4_9GAMM|nr:alanine racemase [Sinobacterium norvegicum]CAH0990239.1 Alanine racemase [Sinobacterium norvegicum]